MDFYHRSRRLLQDSPASGAPPLSHNSYGGGGSFDINMIIILSALLCALICALGINSIVRFILRCARRASSNVAEQTPPPRFGGKGLKKGLLHQIPVAVYGSENGVAFTDCPICLVEFVDGEKIRVLPECHHCFHVRCVDVWLASHSTCPTCRRSLVECGGGEAVVEVVGGQVGDGDDDAPATASGSAEEVG